MKRLLFTVPSWGRHSDLKGHSGWLGGGTRIPAPSPPARRDRGQPDGDLRGARRGFGGRPRRRALTFFLLAG